MEKAEINRQFEIEQSDAAQALINSITITTEAVPNLKITKRIDVISAQAAFEINNFRDMFVGFMNPVKGRANELEKQLDDLKVKSTQKLKAKAHEVGANAVVAVDLDLSTVTIGSISMMMMMASGTAVVIEGD
ncbi:MAG: heavy metal-binding domain-containing protein [Paracoccaceae bacterium]|nr:heavy metal-binding domain-containing protein [Paracoccaceae bacterium]